MSTAADPYREWDAAYVLGSLSPSERREYELHLADCPDCAAAIADLAGISGILSVVPVTRATALLVAEDDVATAVELPVPPTLLSSVQAAARRSERKKRARVVGWASAGL